MEGSTNFDFQKIIYRILIVPSDYSLYSCSKINLRRPRALYSRTSSGLRGSLSGRMLEECVYGKEAEKIVTAHRLVGGGVIGTRGGSLVWNAG